jgi:tripartite-type tricarboxylate transporter receptor subunit TctC
MPIITPKEVNYDPLRDLEPLAHCASIVVDMVVRSDSPFKKFEDLEKYAKENPGKLNIGIPGIGLQPYFNYHILKANGIEMNLVITKGVPQNISFLLGGQIDVAPNSLAADAPYIREGKFRPLALFLKVRHPDFPEIPTIAEKGYPDAAFAFWIGFFAPKGTSKSALDVLIPAFKKVMESPDVVNQLRRLFFFVEYRSPDELRSLILDQQGTIRDIAVRTGLIK